MKDIANRNCTSTLRGIAILIIMMGHIGVSGFDFRVFNPFGGIGVAMFLFLSGYGLTESYKENGLSNFWKKKMMRIAIPYLIWIPIYHIVMQLSPLGNMNHLEIIPRYWFVEYLLIAYFLFYILFKYHPQKAIVIMTIIGGISFLTLDNLRTEQSLSFITGIIFSRNKLFFNNKNKEYILSIAFLSLFIGLISLYIKQLPIIRIYDLESIQFKLLNLFIKLPIGISIVFVFFATKRDGIKWLMHIGNRSYELYLTHIPFYMSIIGRMLYLIIFIAQTVILSNIVYYLNKHSFNKISFNTNN